MLEVKKYCHAGCGFIIIFWLRSHATVFKHGGWEKKVENSFHFTGLWCSLWRLSWYSLCIASHSVKMVKEQHREVDVARTMWVVFFACLHCCCTELFWGGWWMGDSMIIIPVFDMDNCPIFAHPRQMLFTSEFEIGQTKSNAEALIILGMYWNCIHTWYPISYWLPVELL